jgi:hypothetical protein
MVQENTRPRAREKNYVTKSFLIFTMCLMLLGWSHKEWGAWDMKNA